MDAGVRSTSAINREKERDRERGRVRRRFLEEKGETQVFGLPKFWEKNSEGKKRKGKEKRKERRKGKKRKKEGRGGDGRRSSAAAGVGRSWPEKAAKAPNPNRQVGCKYSSF